MALWLFRWPQKSSTNAPCLTQKRCVHSDPEISAAHPSPYTFVCLLKACGSISDVEGGMKLHMDAEGRDFTRDIYVGSTLVSMYGKCGSLPDAECVFFQLPQRNVVSWNAMLSSYVWNSASEKAIKLYRQMHEEGVNANPLTFVAVLKACSIDAIADADDGLEKRLRSCQVGRALHSDAHRKLLASNAFVGNTLLSMYSRCKCANEAENVFLGLSARSIISWNVMLSLYMEQNECVKVLQSYRKLHEEGMDPDHETMMLALQACHSFEEKGETIAKRTVPVKICQAIQVDAWRKGFRSDVIVGSMLISMYSKYDDIAEAETVFAALLEPDIVAWNAMLSGYVKHQQEHNAFKLYAQMQEESIYPDEWTFVACVQACASLAVKEESTRLISLEIGRALHADARRKGFEARIYVSNTLISMYGKCGNIPAAENVFRGMLEHDTISWNALLSVYVEQGLENLALQFYLQMHIEGLVPDVMGLATALHVCGDSVDSEEPFVLEGSSTKYIFLKIGRALHADALLKGFDSNMFLRSTLISMYSRCGKIIEAENVFLMAPKQDVVLCNVMLSAYLEHRQKKMSLQLYRLMQEQSFYLDDERTIVLALKACCLDAEDLIEGKINVESCLEIGQAVHTHAWRKGFTSNIFVACALISMYSRCGYMLKAEYVFEKITKRNVVAWNTMLSAYLERGEGWKTLQLYREMQLEGVKPDQQTLVTALQACCTLAENGTAEKAGKPMKKIVLEVGQALHVDAMNIKGASTDAFVGGALVTMYGNCDAVHEAEATFDSLLEHNLVIWNAMICIYVEQNNYEKAIYLYVQMIKDDHMINDVTLVCILQAFIGTGSLVACYQIHFIIVLGENYSCPLLSTSLIHAYGSSGCMTDAEAIFNGLFQPDVVSWSSCIAGFGREGNYEASIQFLEEMNIEGIAADELTYCSFLSSCSHTGHVDMGLETFVSMIKDSAIIPELKHYASIIDLLGRAGKCTKAEEVLRKSPMQPDLAVWLSLLSACCLHSNVELARRAFISTVHLQPGDPAGYALIENIYRQCYSMEKSYGVDHVAPI